MIAVRQFGAKAVAVLGLGRSGLATVRALRAGGAVPVCWDDNESARSVAEKEGFAVASLHEGEVWQKHDFAALVLSPGIAHLYPTPHPVVGQAWAHGVPVDNDVGLFFAEIDDLTNAMVEDGRFFEAGPPEIVCITGSNGKSTTTALVAHILEQAGRRVQMGGNIGRGVLDLDMPEAGDVIVLELSSYQIELARYLSPSVAVFLNFSPDHYDRHGGRGGYFAAKRRLFDVGMPGRSIIGVDEEEGRFLAGSVGGGVTVISAQRALETWPERAVYVCAEGICETVGGTPTHKVAQPVAPALPGVHNQQNLCAAYAVCRELELSPDVIMAGAASFPGLPHRMEAVAQLGEIRFVNDSKATNVDAAARALSTFDNIYWIAGGQAKEGGLDGLLPHMGNVRQAYLIGESAPLFARLLEGRCALVQSGTLERAVAQALADARQGGGPAVVLLAPACASFDQFRSFEARGAQFRALVQALVEAAGGAGRGAG